MTKKASALSRPCFVALPRHWGLQAELWIFGNHLLSQAAGVMSGSPQQSGSKQIAYHRSQCQGVLFIPQRVVDGTHLIAVFQIGGSKLFKKIIFVFHKFKKIKYFVFLRIS